jgi:hypothetical protein
MKKIVKIVNFVVVEGLKLCAGIYVVFIDQFLDFFLLTNQNVYIHC